MKGASVRSREMGASNGTPAHALVVSELPSGIPVLNEELAIVRAHLGEAIDGILASNSGEAIPPPTKPVALQCRCLFSVTAPSHANQTTPNDRPAGGNAT